MWTLAGNPFELKDQELYVMGGLGVEFFASDVLSFELGLKFRYLTRLFTDFKDNKDIVGSDPGQLDLPRGIAEGLLGLTFHFGGSCPPVNATTSGTPTSGPVPLEVQFDATAAGGCGGYTYVWDFGDSTTSTDQNPKHVYARDGNYTALAHRQRLQAPSGAEQRVDRGHLPAAHRHSVLRPYGRPHPVDGALPVRNHRRLSAHYLRLELR
jgi:hypothetical protein